MKYPQLCSFETALLLPHRFDAIIDARSPQEFLEDHIPGAINCPVLDDEERVLIGTLYKQVSAFEAKKRGAALVAKNIARHIETQFLAHPREWQPLIYCWRGGNRSGAMSHILAKIGWPAHQLEKGYKDYRKHVIEALMTLPQNLQFIVLCGETGTGKSRLLSHLAARGAQVLDLEQRAAHRGSLLGNLPGKPQPTQKMFESLIWNDLRKMTPDRPVFVESESRKVGNLRVPEVLMDKIRAAPCARIVLDFEKRIELLMQDYAHFVHTPAQLNEQLAHLIQRHGHAKIRHWQHLALSDQLPTLVGELLHEHYDPLYTQSIERNFICYAKAQTLTLTGITDADFQHYAKALAP